MSQENVEIAERALDGYNRRDLSVFDELTTADFELLTAVTGSIEGGGIGGRESVQRYFEMLDETWEEFLLVPRGVSRSRRPRARTRSHRGARAR